MSGRARRAFDVLAVAFAVLVAINCTAALVYGIQRPEMTQTQVMLAAAEWAVPFRWLW